MNTTKLVMVYAIVIFSLSINFVYTQQQCESEICTQLSQLCSANADNRYPSITPGVPGKRGPKGEKGESSTYEENGEMYGGFAGKLASIHKQLISVQDENQRLKADLDETKAMCNNKITGVDDKIQELLSNRRLKLCGLLQRPSKIEDGRFSASSHWANSDSRGAAYQEDCLVQADLEAGIEWLTKWIQVDLEIKERIYGVATQGRNNACQCQWVTSYSVLYKTDIGGSFLSVNNESGYSMVFQGNSDYNTPVIRDFLGQSPLDISGLMY